MNNLSNTARLLNVAFINTIKSSGNYGASLAQTRMSVADANGVNVFPRENGSIDYRTLCAPSLNGVIYTPTNAETLGVVYADEPTTLLANTTYSFYFTQFNPYTGVPNTQLISYNTGTGALTAGTAATAWYAQMVEYGFQIAAYSFSGHRLTITALAGYPIINIYQPVNLGAGTALHTAGVVSNGVSYDMEALNGRGSSWSSYPGYISTNNYAKYDMLYTLQGGQQCETVMFVNAGDTNFATNFVGAFNTAILELGSPTLADVAAAVATSV